MQAGLVEHSAKAPQVDPWHSGLGSGLGVWQTRPSIQMSPAWQQLVPHGVVPATQLHRRRPVASFGWQSPEQQLPLLAQMSPPARHTAASPVWAAPMPINAAAPTARRVTKRRRVDPRARLRARSSNRFPSMRQTSDANATLPAE